MGFWLLRAIVGLLAVTATIVPAAATAFHGYEVLEANQEEDRKRADAQLELVLFQTEIAIEAALISSKSDDVKPFLTVALEEARTSWLTARDHWREGEYYLMGVAIENGHHQLARDGIVVAPDPNGGATDTVERPSYPWDVAAGGALAALLLWSIWSGMTRAPRPAVPVPIFPGEVEVERPPEEEEEEAPSSAIPNLGPVAEKKARKPRAGGRARITGTATRRGGAGAAASSATAPSEAPPATAPAAVAEANGATEEPAVKPGHLDPSAIDAQGSTGEKKRETGALAPEDD